MSSRIPGFYNRPVDERLRLLIEQGLLTEEDYETLLDERHVVGAAEADHLIENVIGVFGIPMGLGLNFLINGKDYVIPMVIEEPSVVAAVSSAAKTARSAGGFFTESTDPLLIGQIQVVGVDRVDAASEAVEEAKTEILALANSMHPNMVARGGGGRDIEINVHPATSESPEMLIVHLLVDTCNAMGANLVNSMCEEVAPLIEKLTGGTVFLRILSNLTAHALVKARVEITEDQLESEGFTGSEVRDGIILASQFAEVDSYRATTNNKGVMNGIDAVALATGNDWRAIEASAHAYASLRGRYCSFTRWWKTPQGHLGGSLEIPLKVGTVGGQMESNPAARIARRILNVGSARELAEVMGAVGLAQNLSAVRALSTEGIQRGHMSLHARSIAVAAGTPPAHFEEVVQRLVDSGEIKVWKAQEIVDELRATSPEPEEVEELTADTGKVGLGYGKVILLGEHSVVYGRHALAAPIDVAIRATIEDSENGIQLYIPSWNVTENMSWNVEPKNSLETSLQLILRELGLDGKSLSIQVHSGIPRAVGLGGSAALAVAVIRAVDRRFDLGLSDESVNSLAYQAEQIAHGRASGIDNSVATFGRPILFQRADPPKIEQISIGTPTPMVVGMTGREGLTAAMVSRVAKARESSPDAYERIFDEIDTLTLQARVDLEQGNLRDLGRCMDLCHGLLNALQVSTHTLEKLVEVARANGALGAKLTGAGGGGAMIALTDDPEHAEQIARAIRASGCRAFLMTLRENDPNEPA